MAQIRISPDELNYLSQKCRALADERCKNMQETRKVLTYINQAWDGGELVGYSANIIENEKQTQEIVCTLQELAKQLDKAADSMRTSDQQLASSIRNIFG